MSSNYNMFLIGIQDCLDSLSFREIDARYQDIEVAPEGTCAWLFEQQEYRDWLNGEGVNEHHRLLWINGKPGAGKSILMKHAFQNAQQNFRLCATAGFFFNARGDTLEKTSLGLFRSLLHQLFRKIRPLLREFLPRFRNKREMQGKICEWHARELQDFFYSAVAHPQMYQILLFIDALDECDERQARNIVDFFQSLVSDSSGSSLKICLSSRHYPHISIRNCPKINVEDQNGPDIMTYLRTKLRPMIDEQVSELEKAIIQKASGVFLWVVLVVEMLIEAVSDGEPTKLMRDMLQGVPPKLDDLFVQILNKGTIKNLPETLQMMRWVLLAERPLTPTELLCALGHGTEEFRDNDQRERFIRSRSKGLIEVRQEKLDNIDDHDRNTIENEGETTRAIVQFIHESVRDFVIQGKGFEKIDACIGKMAIGKGHDLLTRSCFNYIKAEEISEITSQSDSAEKSSLQPTLDHYDYLSTTYPFLEYAINYVFKHAEKAEAEGISQTELVRDFQQPTDHMFQCWRRLHDLGRKKIRKPIYGPETTLLHIAALYNLKGGVIFLLESELDINANGSIFGTALQAASYGGHESLVRLLLENGADFATKNIFGWTALHQASESGHTALVRLLLDKDANIAAKNELGWTALHRGAWNGHLDVVRLLLDRMADVNSNSNSGWTALHVAAWRDHEAVVRLLLKVGANLAAQDERKWTALHWAAFHGSNAIVKLLIEEGADVTAQDLEQMTALHVAAWSGREETVRLLLETANVDAQDKRGWTALNWAMEMGYEAVVKLLVEKGANIAARDKIGWTVMHWAIWSTPWSKQHADTIEWFLIEKADVATPDERGWTALHWAALFGCKESVTLLLEIGVDVAMRANDGVVSLHLAAWGGHKAVVKLLLENGADVAARDESGWKALHWVQLGEGSPQNQEEMTRILLEKETNMSMSAIDRIGALRLAVRGGLLAVIRLFLEKGFGVIGQDEQGWAILHWAAWVGNEAVVQLLLEKGADAGTQAIDGMTALHLAALGGHEAIVRMLLKANADITGQDERGWTALHWVAWDGDTGKDLDALIRLLVSSGAQAEARDNYGQTPLHLAAEAGREVAIQVLSDMGAHINAKDSSGMTALHWAASRGYEEVMRLLQEKGAGATIQDNQGRTAVDLAEIANTLDSHHMRLAMAGLDSSRWAAVHDAAASIYNADLKLISPAEDIHKAFYTPYKTMASYHGACSNMHETAAIMLSSCLDAVKQSRNQHQDSEDESLPPISDQSSLSDLSASGENLGTGSGQ